MVEYEDKLELKCMLTEYDLKHYEFISCQQSVDPKNRVSSNIEMLSLSSILSFLELLSTQIK